LELLWETVFIFRNKSFPLFFISFGPLVWTVNLSKFVFGTQLNVGSLHSRGSIVNPSYVTRVERLDLIDLCLRRHNPYHRLSTEIWQPFLDSRIFEWNHLKCKANWFVSDTCQSKPFSPLWEKYEEVYL
jgi:hypothetical protein